MTGGSGSSDPMHVTYPITSKWEFTLENGDKAGGEVYCTDPVAGLLVLIEQGDIRMVSVGNIQESKLLQKATSTDPLPANMMHTKKALDEREKRGIRLAQERYAF